MASHYKHPAWGHAVQDRFTAVHLSGLPRLLITLPLSLAPRGAVISTLRWGCKHGKMKRDPTWGRVSKPGIVKILPILRSAEVVTLGIFG